MLRNAESSMTKSQKVGEQSKTGTNPTSKRPGSSGWVNSTVLFLPALVALFSHANLPDRIQTRHSLRGQHLNLPQLRDKLFRLWSLVGRVFRPFY
jgi:hypothetical protein